MRIAFDDFGSGVRALHVLRTQGSTSSRSPARSWTARGASAHDRAVLSMIVQVASMFELQVVAQGIEREDQRQALAAMGCELGQGYLLGRPLPLAPRLPRSRCRSAPISAGNRGFSSESLPFFR